MGGKKYHFYFVLFTRVRIYTNDTHTNVGEKPPSDPSRFDGMP